MSGDLLDDDLPHTTLSYANGKGFHLHNVLDGDGANVTRLNLTEVPEERIKSFGFVQVGVWTCPENRIIRIEQSMEHHPG